MWWILTAHAATWTVPGDFTTLSEAVSSPLVVDDDVIQLGAGEFAGFSMSSLRLTVRGVAAPQTSRLVGSGNGGPIIDLGTTTDLTLESVTIDGAGVDAGILASNSSTLVITGSTLIGGTSNRGGCIEAEGGSLTISDTAFTGCTCSNTGGAIHLKNGSTVSVSGSTFDLNSAQHGGAIYVEDSTQVDISTTLFDGNATTSDDGGSIALRSSTGTLTEVTITSSTADRSGGALHLEDTLLVATDLLIDGAASGQRGGAIESRNGSVLDLSRSTILNATADDRGGALHSRDGDVVMRNVFVCNAASLNQGEGHAIQAENGIIDVQNVLFADNGVGGAPGFSVQGIGGGLFAHATFIGDVHNGIQTAGSAVEDNLLTDSTGIGLDEVGLGAPSVVGNVLFGPTIAGGIDANDQIQADPGIVTSANDCAARFYTHASSAAVRDTTASPRLDIDGSAADAGHFGGPDFDPVFWEADQDGDGFLIGYDCDDTDASIHPGATEIPCNGIDESCGTTPDGAEDADNDGFDTCGSPADCDDTNAQVNPGATELTCNGLDDDCDPATVDGPDGDGDGAAACVDCDDSDPDNFPGNPEVCDSADNDCDTVVDNGLTFVDYYTDSDGDTYGGASAGSACTPIPGAVTTSGDCDDNAAEVFPGASETCNGADDDCDSEVDEGLPVTSWYTDDDDDGFGDGLAATECLQPPGTADTSGDCDDTDPNTYPGAIETCDGEDDDCNGTVDDGVVTTDWYADNDGDGYGAAFVATDCAQPANTVANGLDCDDTNAAISPDATEVCNGIDQDCDGTPDNGVPAIDWFEDLDGDGFGDVLLDTSCQQPSGSVSDGGDCDDVEPLAYPGADEDCDGIDNDCDSLVDDADPDTTASTWYPDADGDNYGDEAASGTVTCTAPPDTIDNAGDCDDSDATIFPFAVEACPDGIDNDCDGLVDAEDTDYTDDPVVFWFDQDGDGVGTSADTFEGCSGDQPPGYVSPNLGEDCNDGDLTISPLNGELCDGIDNDCTGIADDGLSFADFYPDTDGDGFGDPNGTPVNDCQPVPGYSVDATDCNDMRSVQFPGNPEICDNLDNDCNGTADDGLPVSTWYPDSDGDGFGSATQSVTTCEPVPGWIALGGDCDDTDPLVNPVAVEIEDDGIDNDCDGFGGTPDMTGDTGIEAPPLDSDGDDVPDSIDPDPFSAGDVSGNPPEPAAGCSCSAPGPLPAGWLALGALTVVLRRRTTRSSGPLRSP